MGKIPLSSLLARYLICLSPMYMTESPEACELLFDKMLMKWNECPAKMFLLLQLTLEKWQFFTFLFMFLKTVVHDNGEEFSYFSKEHNRLDHFLWNFMDTKTFDDPQHVIKVVLILAHGQAQVEQGFNDNKWLIASEKLNSNYFKSSWSGQSIQALSNGWNKIFSQTYLSYI